MISLVGQTQNSISRIKFSMSLSIEMPGRGVGIIWKDYCFLNLCLRMAADLPAFVVVSATFCVKIHSLK